MSANSSGSCTGALSVSPSFWSSSSVMALGPTAPTVWPVPRHRLRLDDALAATLVPSTACTAKTNSSATAVRTVRLRDLSLPGDDPCRTAIRVLWSGCCQPVSHRKGEGIWSRHQLAAGAYSGHETKSPLSSAGLIGRRSREVAFYLEFLQSSRPRRHETGGMIHQETAATARLAHGSCHEAAPSRLLSQLSHR